ncbi:MAG: phosphoglucosamine mutase [Clostridiales bacterium]|jgi:phosphoglucosamine mutase|nr:phosphoglucosamine mutase [Clostridiales bacterium]
MGKLFGTDGVRGVVGTELTPELAFSLGQAGSTVLGEQEHHKPRILIGNDTRISSGMLEAALSAGICSVGAEAVLVGVAPTPAISYLTRKLGFDAGVVISASHNPVEYNGIKFFNRHGYKLDDALESEIEDIILNKKDVERKTGVEVGRIVNRPILLDEYIDFLKSTINVSLFGQKIALDCANGASSYIAAKIFTDLGAEVIQINNQPSGENINLRCGSTHLAPLKMCVTQNCCNYGFAFDGDADRMLAVDENGTEVDGDQILMICGGHLKRAGKLKNNTIVATVMSNLGLTIAAKEQNISIATTDVGDRYVIAEMLRGNHCLGGEQSGHIIFLDYNTTGDGLLTALQLASTIVASNKKLSELSEVMTILPQVLVNAKVPNDKKFNLSTDADISKKISLLEKKMQGNGRVLIRPSGTEPLVRVMLEGADVDYIRNEAKILADYIEQKLA